MVQFSKGSTQQCRWERRLGKLAFGSSRRTLLEIHIAGGQGNRGKMNIRTKFPSYFLPSHHWASAPRAPQLCLTLGTSSVSVTEVVWFVSRQAPCPSNTNPTWQLWRLVLDGATPCSSSPLLPSTHPWTTWTMGSCLHPQLPWLDLFPEESSRRGTQQYCDVGGTFPHSSFWLTPGAPHKGSGQIPRGLEAKLYARKMSQWKKLSHSR